MLIDDAEMRIRLQAYRAAPEGARDAQAGALFDALVTVVRDCARRHMAGHGPSQNFAAHHDLAQDYLLGLLNSDGMLANFDPALPSTIAAYVSQMVKNHYLKDLQRIAGSSRSMPRIFVNSDDLDHAYPDNAVAQRRTQSAYVQLKQVTDTLARYLRQMPGKVFFAKQDRKVMNHHHVYLLKAWMGEEGALSWDDVAKQLGAGVSTVKRRFREVQDFILIDQHPDAVRLRNMYSINGTPGMIAPGESTKADVVALFGKALEARQDGATEVWFYPYKGQDSMFVGDLDGGESIPDVEDRLKRAQFSITFAPHGVVLRAAIQER